MEDLTLARSAERTLRLIETILAHPEGLTPQDLMQKLGLSRSSLFVLLKTLKTLGYLDQSEKRGRYLPGPRLLAWQARGDLSQQELLAAFYQECAQTAWPETLALVVPISEGLLVLAQTEGSYETRRVFQVGKIYPHLEAAQALFAPSSTPLTIEEGMALAQSNETLDLAAPICPDGYQPRAAVVLSALAYRWQPHDLYHQWGNDVRNLAARISHRLGALTYSPFQPQPVQELQPLEPLTPAQMEAFLRGPVSARLACVRPDGQPHVIPLWQEWNGHAFIVIAWQGSRWPEYVRQNPAVSLTIDEPWPPLRRVVARGQANPVTDLTPQELQRLLNRLGRRYLGRDLAQPYLNQVAEVFRIDVEYLRGWRGLTTALTPA
ncbi:helix-turn-helix domain-containing protein [Thermanaerothrix sp. 4228-RoL]|uniref:Helix-turn-helix domain-containing protein n=1 Tax=Thermanaerothrix solaris TaxID=3058434 RepID=A0ABU3NP51_9CHLR|nr:helix-turn-helix domain-containing protein [Thermanaerothrix sp. 4228-RoL]MDT8897576.1 helix-turn-helix domain-containing protein [Thermanaerothrix sp. 4228-RoL]